MPTSGIKTQVYVISRVDALFVLKTKCPPRALRRKISYSGTIWAGDVLKTKCPPRALRRIFHRIIISLVIHVLKTKCPPRALRLYFILNFRSQPLMFRIKNKMPTSGIKTHPSFARAHANFGVLKTKCPPRALRPGYLVQIPVLKVTVLKTKCPPRALRQNNWICGINRKPSIKNKMPTSGIKTISFGWMSTFWSKCIKNKMPTSGIKT